MPVNSPKAQRAESTPREHAQGAPLKEHLQGAMGSSVRGHSLSCLVTNTANLARTFLRASKEPLCCLEPEKGPCCQL